MKNVFGVRASRAITAAAVIAASFAHTGPAAAATATSPDFKLPFRCGSEWVASTYSGHGAAIDLNLPNADDRGQPVLAAAAGRISRVTPSTGEVYLEHGGGWATRYLHMSDIRVAVGKQVSEGQWIGRVDTVGKSTGPHLHFEVRRDGTLVTPVVDGSRVSPTPTQSIRVRSTNCLPGYHGFWFANHMLRAPDGTVDYVTPGGERYWVKDAAMVRCLQQSGVVLRQVDWNSFRATPRNEYGDPGGRWAACWTAHIGWMVRGNGPGVFYVAPTGLRYHVTNESTVMCLGGWAAVRGVSDGTLSSIPTNPHGATATCQTPLIGRMVKATQDRVDYVDSRGRRHHVPNSDIVRCLGGWGHVVNVRDSRRDALSVNALGAVATCNTPLVHRLVRRASGQVDYVTTAMRRYWVPNHATVACLGGSASTIYLSDQRFTSIPGNAAGESATCSTRWKP